jgi:hypothetical protein
VPDAVDEESLFPIEVFWDTPEGRIGSDHRGSLTLELSGHINRGAIDWSA